MELKDCWFWDYKTQDFYRWDKLPRQHLWKHYCFPEQIHVLTERGEECNWCGKKEFDEGEIF